MRRLDCLYIESGQVMAWLRRGNGDLLGLFKARAGPRVALWNDLDLSLYSLTFSFSLVD